MIQKLCLFLFLITGTAEGFAQDFAGASSEKIAEIQNQSTTLQEQQREILADIYKMTGLQRRLASKKSQQLQRREELEADVADLQQNIQEVTDQIQTLRKKIVLRMRNLHRVSAPTIFQSFFGAHDLIEMDRNARILYKISKADVEQLRTFRGLKNLLTEQQTQLEKKIAEFEKNQKSLEKQETVIKRTYQAQMNLLRKLGEQDQSMVSKLKEIKKNALLGNTNKETLVAGIFEGGIYEKKGQLELPTTGVLSRRFGLLQMSSPKIRVYNKGWFISTPPQKEVIAIHRGQVAHIGSLPGYEYVVILDHGDHFYSIYANLSSATVRVGDEIEAQTILGLVGQSRIYGQGLYFEIRHFSQSEDPAEWFKDSKFHLSSVKEQEL